MRFTGRMGLLGALVSGAALLLGGCNTGNNNLLEANRALTDRNQALTAQNESLTNLNQQLQAALADRDRTLSEQSALIAALRSGSGDLDARYAALLKQVSDLNFGSLDPTTDAALQQLAAQHSDILEYDAARGLLRFKSDVTFASGSDEVSPAGRQTLNQLASILNGTAANYDLRIVGHTDAQRISANTARKHPTNMHLSAHRAISVRDVLVGSSVLPTRIEVAGRGEFDPYVPNTGSGNTPQNRRVEIFLGKSAGTRASVGAPAPSPIPATTRVTEDIMK